MQHKALIPFGMSAMLAGFRPEFSVSFILWKIQGIAWLRLAARPVLNAAPAGTLLLLLYSNLLNTASRKNMKNIFILAIKLRPGDGLKEWKAASAASRREIPRKLRKEITAVIRLDASVWSSGPHSYNK